MLDVVIATRNRYKVRELSGLLRVPGVRWHSLEAFEGLEDVPERGRTFRANAIAKARAVARATGCLALADDSGLEVDALGGAPGVRSARFAGAHGDDGANNRKLLQQLKGLSLRSRGARYQCVLALADPHRLIAVTAGQWRGRIAERLAGRNGFGYDPVFLVPRYGKTVGQLLARIKQRVSHRAAAAHRLRPILARLVRSAQRVVTARTRTDLPADRPGWAQAAERPLGR